MTPHARRRRKPRETLPSRPQLFAAPGDRAPCDKAKTRVRYKTPNPSWGNTFKLSAPPADAAAQTLRRARTAVVSARRAIDRCSSWWWRGEAPLCAAQSGPRFRS